MSEVVESSLLEQARKLHRTLRALQHRVLLKQTRRPARTSRKFPELSSAQLTTLTVIRDRETSSLKDLAEATCVSPPSASAMVDRLVEMGLVERRSSVTDRREIRISVTQSGLEAAREFEGESLQSLVDLLDKVGPETAHQWGEVYGRIQACLDDDADAHSALAAD